MFTRKIERWSALAAILLVLHAEFAYAQEDAETKAVAAIREVGGGITRDDGRDGPSLPSISTASGPAWPSKTNTSARWPRCWRN